MGRLSAAAYRAFNLLALPDLVRGLRGGAPVFCFHNVVPDERAGCIGDGPLHLGIGPFTEFAGWAAATFRCVTTGELGERLRRGRDVRGLAAITFDDGYHGVFARALPLLDSLGVPATVFIVGAGPGRRTPFWWDTAAGAGRARRELLWDLAGDGARIAPESGAGGTFDPELRTEPWEGIRAATERGHEAGWHTATHRNLAALDETAATSEIASGRDTLGNAGLPPPRSFAYPYGLAGAVSARVVERAGFVAGLTLAYGLAPGGWPAAALPRINIPAGLPRAALRSWAGGVRIGSGPVRLRRRDVGRPA